jgi:hypothetical protein
MILNPNTKNYEQQSHRPNICWQDGWLLIDETNSENQSMIETIKNHAPNIIIEHQDGAITNVIVDVAAEQEETILNPLKPDSKEVQKAERQLQLIDDLNELGVL